MPRSGPAGAAFGSGMERYVDRDPRLATRYIFIDLTKPLAQSLGGSPSQSIPPAGSQPAHGPSAEMLGVGDTLEVTLYEAESGGLFVPSDANGRDGNFIKLPQQRIEQDGTITVPYVGQVRAAGRSRVAVQADIRKRLEDIAIEPDVMISVISSDSAHVSILGDVALPAQLTIGPAGDRLLDVIARAGGLRDGGDDAAISLQRGRQTYRFRLSSLVGDAAQNVPVRPGDLIYVRRDTRSFTVLGAVDQNGTFTFDRTDTSLAQAIGRAGGLADSRADPHDVYVYREIDRAELARLGFDVSHHVEAKVPVIFHADLNDPAEIFAANRFQLNDHDVVYVSNAASYDFGKFMTLLGNISSTASNAAYVATGSGR